MCVSVLYALTPAHHMHAQLVSIWGNQKRVSDPLALEPQVVLSHQVGAGN